MGDVGGISSSNMLRVTGLATGMETDEMVKKMIAAEEIKVDRVRQKKQVLTWKQEAYVDIIKDLKGLYNDYLDILAPNDTNIFSSSAYAGSKAESSDEGKLTARAYGGAINGNYKVEITSIAKGALKSSNKLTKGTETATFDTKLSEVFTDLNDTNTLKITVGSNMVEVNINKDDTIETMVNKIKNQKIEGTGYTLGNYVSVKYSELTGKVSIETKKTGEDTSLMIDGTGSLKDKLGIATKDVSGNVAAIKGTNAKLKITPPGESNGVEVEKSKNNFVIDNIEYNLISSTEGSTVNLSVKPDASEQVEKFKKFVSEYNKIIDKIDKKVSEKTNYKFQPLTEMQKKDMKEDEIKKWEDKAKQGIIKGDSMLTSLKDSLRSIVYSKVEGAGISITDIGISTGNWRNGGKLEIDEEKLKKALETNGDMVQKLFTNDGSKEEEKGILVRMKDTLDKYVGSEGQLIKKAGWKDTRWVLNNDLSKYIKEKEQKIEEMELKLFEKQEKYYKRFAALEKFMSQMNAQANWLYSQMGMGGN